MTDSKTNNFHNYLRAVIDYYAKNKSLRGFSKLARVFNVGGLTKEQFFYYGLHILPSSFLTKEHAGEILQETLSKKRNHISKVAPFDVCTYKNFSTWVDFLKDCGLGITTENLPPLKHGMLVVVRTKSESGNWHIDWFDYATVDRSENEKERVFLHCVCDTYPDAVVYPFTPDTHIFFSSPTLMTCSLGAFATVECEKVYTEWYENSMTAIRRACLHPDERYL